MRSPSVPSTTGAARALRAAATTRSPPPSAAPTRRTPPPCSRGRSLRGGPSLQRSQRPLPRARPSFSAGTRAETMVAVRAGSEDGQLLLDNLNDPARALARFERYLENEPSGALAEEARVGRARALASLDRRDDERAASLICSPGIPGPYTHRSLARGSPRSDPVIARRPSRCGWRPASHRFMPPRGESVWRCRSRPTPTVRRRQVRGPTQAATRRAGCRARRGTHGVCRRGARARDRAQSSRRGAARARLARRARYPTRRCFLLIPRRAIACSPAGSGSPPVSTRPLWPRSVHRRPGGGEPARVRAHWRASGRCARGGPRRSAAARHRGRGDLHVGALAGRFGRGQPPGRVVLQWGALVGVAAWSAQSTSVVGGRCSPAPNARSGRRAWASRPSRRSGFRRMSVLPNRGVRVSGGDVHVLIDLDGASGVGALVVGRGAGS